MSGAGRAPPVPRRVRLRGSARPRAAPSLPPSAPPVAPPAAAPQVFTHARDGDTLVLDPAQPREGYVQFYSVRTGGWRKFVADRVREQLARVTDAATRAAAVHAYRAFAAAHPAPTGRPAGPRVVPRRAPGGARALDRRPERADARFDPDNAGHRRALALLDAPAAAPLLLTGRAGTGKSTFLRALVARAPRRTVVLAPTGLAALNVGGQTIHGFFRFPARPLGPADAAPRRHRALFQAIDTLVVDEVSMVRADLLDAMDRVLRATRTEPHRPFGGVRLVLFGDPHQLPPVVPDADRAVLDALGYPGAHFFDAGALADAARAGAPLGAVEFTTVYRQRDPGFLALLDRVRDGALDPADRAALARRVAPARDDGIDDTIVLTARRARAALLNDRRLARLGGPAREFHATRAGDFPPWETPPAPEVLALRRGARVMLTRNDPDGAWVNGSLGTVVGFHGDLVEVELAGGAGVVRVGPTVWERLRYVLDDATGEIATEVAGRYRQHPLQLAWAITIHKAQGLTFDRVHLDLGRQGAFGGAFAPGQTYVALSRCRTLEGVTLEAPLTRADVTVDPRVAAFFRTVRRGA